MLFHQLTLLSTLLVFAKAQVSSLNTPTVSIAPGRFTLFSYTPQSACDRIGGIGASGYKLLSWRTTGNDYSYCLCLRRGGKDSSGKYKYYGMDGTLQQGTLTQECRYTGKEQNSQGICLYQVKITDSGLQPGATCGACQVVTSLNKRAYRCQDAKTTGQYLTADHCTTPGESLHYDPTIRYGCQCQSPDSAPSSAIRCARPKAGGQSSLCYDTFEDWGENTQGNGEQWVGQFVHKGDGLGCIMRCQTGLHLSPSEKPVTCCQKGYRSNPSGTCAKSTDGRT